MGCETDVGGRTEVGDKSVRKWTFNDKADAEKPEKEWCEWEEEKLGWVTPELRAGGSREGNVQEGLCHTEAKHALLDLSVNRLSRTDMNS